MKIACVHVFLGVPDAMGICKMLLDVQCKKLICSICGFRCCSFMCNNSLHHRIFFPVTDNFGFFYKKILFFPLWKNFYPSQFLPSPNAVNVKTMWSSWACIIALKNNLFDRWNGLWQCSFDYYSKSFFWNCVFLS